MRVKKQNGKDFQQNRMNRGKYVKQERIEEKDKIKKHSRESDTSKDRQRSFNIQIMSLKKKKSNDA